LTLAHHGAGLTPADVTLPPVQWLVNRYELAVSAGGQYSVLQSYPARAVDDASPLPAKLT
jgi:hypothetical protein